MPGQGRAGMTMTMTVSGRGRWIGDRQKRDPRVQRGKRREARQAKVLTWLSVRSLVTRESSSRLRVESTSEKMA